MYMFGVCCYAFGLEKVLLATFNSVSCVCYMQDVAGIL